MNNILGSINFRYYLSSFIHLQTVHPCWIVKALAGASDCVVPLLLIVPLSTQVYKWDRRVKGGDPLLQNGCYV